MASLLRLVHPQGPKPPPPPKYRRAAPLLLTDEEVQHYRAALRNIVRAYGGFPVLASVVGVPLSTLHKSIYRLRQRPSAVLVLRVAKAAGMHVEALLTGKVTEAGRCHTCGARVGDRRAT